MGEHWWSNMDETGEGMQVPSNFSALVAPKLTATSSAASTFSR